MFLGDLQKRHVAFDRPVPFAPIGLYLGQGAMGLEVVVVEAARKPAASGLFERADLATGSKSMAIIEFVLKTGLEPFIAPLPLPPIEEEDVQLIAWIALENEA